MKSAVAQSQFAFGNSALNDDAHTLKLLDDRQRRVLLDLGFAVVSRLAADELMLERDEWGDE